jgi:lipoyl(octanoyl) transferase
MGVDDVHTFLRTMERAIVAALAEEGIAARSRHSEGIDYTGVWVAERKIASIGLHVSHGISTHGFAVNVVNDVEPFSWMIACGLPGVTMSSIASERSAEPSFTRFRTVIAQSFCDAHGRRQRLVPAGKLGIDTAYAAKLAPTRAPIETNASARKSSQPGLAHSPAVPA